VSIVARTANGLPVVVIAPESAESVPGLAAPGALATGASISRIAHACEQSIGLHQQLVLANGVMDQVRAAVGTAPHRRFVRQESQFGDLESMISALRTLGRTSASEFYFLTADAPVTPQGLGLLRMKLRATGAAMMALTGPSDDAGGAADRVVQAQLDRPGSEVLAIVAGPEIDALRDAETISFRTFDGQQHCYTREALLGIRAASVGAYGWRLEALRACVGQLAHRPGSDGRRWVSDLVAVLRRRRFVVRAFPLDHSDHSTQTDAQQALERAGRACSELVAAARGDGSREAP